MSERYPGGFVTKTPPTLNPALGNSTPGVWTLDQVMQNIKAGTWPAYDPYFEYTTLLLHGNGTNGAQNNTFLDSSTNNFTITRNGNTTQGTFTPYGSNWSNFNPDSDNGIGVATNAALNMGTGDFTVEAWVNTAKLPTTNAFQTSSGGYQCVFGTGPNSSATGTQLYIGVTNLFFDISSDGSGPISVAHNMVAGQWYHVAITRSGTTFRAFINGTLVQTATSSASWVNGYGYGIMRSEPIGGYGGAWWYGYISNLRIVKGTAVYTSNFTPSTSPLTAITNTSLLTCQSNRFIDNSSNAFAVTVNGSPSVQRFSPFNPSAPYAAGTIGGSGYFDGSGDYLDASASAGLGGSGNFTLQAWIYPTTVAGDCCIYETRGGTGWVFFINSSGYLQVYDSTATLQTASTTLLKAYQWTHVALVKNSSTCTYYVNGSAAGTFTLSTFQSATRTRVGARNDAGAPYFGWICDLRTDTTNLTITVPTAPLTAGANTNFLLNMTNGGIIDNAMMMNGETVGTAEISTSVVKYGTGSISTPGGTGVKFRPNGTNSADAMFGTGDFTIECWVYITQNTANAYPIGCTQDPYVNDNTSINWMLATNQGSGGAKLNLLLNNNQSGITIITGTSTLSNNVWIHLAATRSSGTVRLFVNGNLETTTANTNNVNTPSSFVFANWGPVGGNRFAGYIDDLRITKGYARYTANFTPQTSQWQDQ